jgi:N4-(beta-N-acetylglucosaminyl)-L-asparaginase
MLGRRKFLKTTAYSSLAGFIPLRSMGMPGNAAPANLPLVISTWDAGVEANKGAWAVLSQGGRALDAVEKGVMVTESSQSCCVGLGGNPDREGIVTLDACIMDEHFNCGSVAALERIKHPISVARRIMEKTPHVLLVGSGAQQFAIAEGFTLESQELSPDAKKAYANWLKKSEYKPIMNIENKGNPINELNHDTIGMIAMDMKGNLSGSCTTSGMGFKMRGRVGDSPIIGAGLYVDNEVGACTATGQGEDVIRVAGASAVVEAMRSGLSPEAACKKIIERIITIKKEKAKDIQVAFIAISKEGKYGAYAIQKGFSYAVTTPQTADLIVAKSYFS